MTRRHLLRFEEEYDAHKMRVLVDIIEKNWREIYGRLKELEDLPAIKPITSTTYPITGRDGTLLLDASSNTVTATLPTAVNIEGKIIITKAINVDNSVVLDTTGGETIDGVSSVTFILNQARTVQSDGANWHQVT